MNATKEIKFYLWDGVPGSYKDGQASGNLWDGLDYRYTQTINMDNFIDRPGERCKYESCTLYQNGLKPTYIDVKKKSGLEFDLTVDTTTMRARDNYTFECVIPGNKTEGVQPVNVSTFH